MNLFKQFLDLLPPRPLEVGTVQSIYSGIATIELPGGAQIKARGAATVGQHVFEQGGQILGEAPALPIDIIEV